MPAPRALLVLLAAALALGACGRSPLLPAEPRTPPLDAGPRDAPADQPADLPPDLATEAAADVPPDLAPDLPPDVVPDLGRDLSADLPVERRPEPAPEPPPDAARPDVGPPPCQPQPETCNGRDDDCDGQVDEDQPAIPCPDGGNRYCVAGRYSECPRRCEVCVPGSRRTCFVSFCTYWGSQACAADGRSFGACRESPVPQACDAVAARQMKSPALEQCCLDSGGCCLDEFDLDGDGDRAEMLGRCEGVLCAN